MKTLLSQACFGLFVLLSCSVVASAQTAPQQVPDMAVAPQKFVSDLCSVEVVGAGPDVILLPGFASGREVWRPLANSLAPHYRVHLVQYAGFAGEPWKNGDGPFVSPLLSEIARYIKVSGLKSPAVIGHSMGGAMGVMLAQQNPSLVSRVLSVDSLPFFAASMSDKITPEIAESFGKQMAAAMLATDDAKFRQQQTQTAQSLSRTPAMQEMIVDWSMTSDRHALAAALTDLMALDLRPHLAAMTTPVWAMYASDTTAENPPETATALWKREYAALPGVKFILVENTRHFIMADQPEKLEEIVQNFLTAP